MRNCRSSLGVLVAFLQSTRHSDPHIYHYHSSCHWYSCIELIPSWKERLIGINVRVWSISPSQFSGFAWAKEGVVQVLVISVRGMMRAELHYTVDLVAKVVVVIKTGKVWKKTFPRMLTSIVECRVGDGFATIRGGFPVTSSITSKYLHRHDMYLIQLFYNGAVVPWGWQKPAPNAEGNLPRVRVLKPTCASTGENCITHLYNLTNIVQDSFWDIKS